jgi:hypothetical protein
MANCQLLMALFGLGIAAVTPEGKLSGQARNAYSPVQRVAQRNGCKAPNTQNAHFLTTR